jgi:hypothetical protein
MMVSSLDYGIVQLSVFVLMGLQVHLDATLRSTSLWNASIAQTSMDIHDPIHHDLRFVVNARGLNELPSFNLRPTPLPDKLSPGLFSAHHPWANHSSTRERTYEDWATLDHQFNSFYNDLREIVESSINSFAI